MTLNANEPTDQRQVDELPAYVREDRVAINSIEVQAADVNNSITTINLSVSTGSTALVVGVDLSDLKIENILIAGIGASTIETIRGGTEGQVKTFIFQDNDISFKDGDKNSGKIYLNQLPVLSILNAQLNDVISLVNIGGNGSDIYGYWKELWRQLSVK